ncbi:hypothetical protein FSARC_9427 [Fusarium sarcochroum]|uniref:NACHT domain-containing protein n=1 Tax=Fusarium sarcochroum TaxID=1208366 RepID=A0A8H4TRG6_9HYPO|nr:hypothetical protein FSARC_9427 [Fusarium sarcochroum]
MATSNSAVQNAFERAILDFKTKFKDQSFYDQILRTNSIDEVCNDIQKLQDEQAKAGRLRHLSKIEPFLSRLRDYSSVIETFVQAKPDILALIWGPIKLLLLWADVLKQSFDALVNTLEEIGHLLPEFCEVTGIFADNNRLQELLVLFFRDILDFYLIATNFFSMRRLRVLFQTIWPSRRDQIQVVVKHIARHRDLMRNEVRIEEIRTANDLRERELQHFAQMEENNIKQEYASHRAHISPKDYDADLYRFSEAVCDGTGKWLFRDPPFKDWLAGTEKSRPILWLKGIPGAGKTLLASSVIKYTQQLDNTRTIFAFLTYKDCNISALSIIHSLIFQLTSHSLTLKTAFCQSELQHLRSDFAVATTLLQSLIQGAGTVHIIVDGLDEIDQAQRSKLIKELVRLSGNCEECRILFSSRPEADISTALDDNTTSIQVDQQNAGSIQVFINRTMEEWFEDRGFFSQTRHQIQGWAAPLASRAKGMFLYVRVIFRMIYYINNTEDIQKELEHLPVSLEDAYGRVLQQINSYRDPTRKNIARLILGWVGCAPSSLTTQEIEQALIVNPDQPNKQSGVVSMTSVVQVCGPIVEVVDGYVQFVHFTVREYIFSSKIEGSISLPDMSLDLAMRCITYLCQDHHDPSLTEHGIDDKILWGAYRLHDFSSKFWLHLINQYLALSGATTLPASLIDQLKTLLDTQCSEDYIHTDRDETSLHPAIVGLDSQEPVLVEMLRNVVDFQFTSSKSDCQLNNSEQWFHLSPLSLPRVSIALYRRLHGDQRGSKFERELISYHYGRNSFKCGVLGCQYQRYGFATESSRTSHERHHQKPWKCSFPGCQYTKTGFISNKMRDDHLRNSHRPVTHSVSANPEAPDIQDDEEVQPLLFDLIESNQVQAVESLLSHSTSLSPSVQIELAMSAASMGSASILELFINSGLLYGAFAGGEKEEKKFEKLCQVAIKSQSVATSRLLLGWQDLYVIARLIPRFDGILNHITCQLLEAESENIYELWKPILGSVFGVQELQKEAHAFLYEGTIGSTNNNPNRERMLLAFWDQFKILRVVSERHRNILLPTIARTTCSINLTRYALEHGCEVDYRTSPSSFTALHQAAKKTTKQAANLMEFLLLQGADPNKDTARRKIKQEVGALRISKWLGVTWDELVEKTAKERNQNNT